MINWHDIDTVLLDMDGTLLDLHYDNYFWKTHLPQRYAEITQQPLNEVEEQLAQQIRAIEGTLNWYCLEYWQETLNVDIKGLKEEVQHKIKERPFVQAFLKFLKEQGKDTILVTNSHRIGLDIKLKVTDIGQHLDRIVCSHDFKVPKEEQIFWQQLKQDLQFDPNRTLFIDDNLAILKAAKTFGIAYTLGIHQPDSQTQRQLNHPLAINHFNEIIPADFLNQQSAD